MQRLSLIVLLGASVGVAACSMDNPAEVRDGAQEFPVVAIWNATAEPADTDTVSTESGVLSAEQHLGFRVNATFTLTGTPGKTYQWRIFRGDCATTEPAEDNSVTGLLLFSTEESYPDIHVDASGTGSASPAIAGALDSLTAYSVRVRPSQTSTDWDGTDPIACGDMQRTPAN
ncbi:MAG TPA: hypothetical protein VFK04_02320 [Gemmatimonadaceae bacterium]|jgi:hypothetical protein|nr:hypothetical protein [Gemmatimonadaceae bacterium]